jgi:hypothetical protein
LVYANFGFGKQSQNEPELFQISETESARIERIEYLEPILFFRPSVSRFSASRRNFGLNTRDQECSHPI